MQTNTSKQNMGFWSTKRTTKDNHEQAVPYPAFGIIIHNLVFKGIILFYAQPHIPQFFRRFRSEAILYCRAMNKLYLANPLCKRFCEKCKSKLRNVGSTISYPLTWSP